MICGQKIITVEAKSGQNFHRKMVPGTAGRWPTQGALPPDDRLSAWARTENDRWYRSCSFFKFTSFLAADELWPKE